MREPAGSGHLPLDVRRLLGALCSVALALGSAAEGRAQVSARHFEAGFHFGFRVTERGPEQERWGLQIFWPVAGPFEVVGVASERFGFPGVPELEGAAREGLLAAGWRPFGRSGPLAVGYGLRISYLRLEVRPAGQRTAETTASDAAFLRAIARAGPLHPFAMLLVSDLLANRDPVTGHLFLGVSALPF